MQTLTSTLLEKQSAKSTSVTDRVKTFEDACRELGIVPSQLSITGENLNQGHLAAVTSHFKMIIIAEALNGDWIPDYENKNQPKYYPWFEYKKGSGFVLNYVNLNCYDRTDVGARLCYRTSDIARYAATQFQKEYNDFLSRNSNTQN